MRVLRDESSMRTEIEACPDPGMRHLLTRRVEFACDCDDQEVGELLNVIVIESGDNFQEIDAEFRGQFLVNHYSGKRFGDPGFLPSFETLEEYPTFYEMFFVQSDEGFGVAVLIPKSPGIDPDLLAVCVRDSVPAP